MYWFLRKSLYECIGKISHHVFNMANENDEDADEDNDKNMKICIKLCMCACIHVCVYVSMHVCVSMYESLFDKCAIISVLSIHEGVLILTLHL